MKVLCNNRKIRVCNVITKMVYGGASLGTLHLAKSLDPCLFESTVICGVQSEQEGNLLNNMQSFSIKVVLVSVMVREINIVKDFMTLFKLVNLIERGKYDIVHTHGSKAGVIGRLAAAWCRTPVIVHTVHGWGLKAGNPRRRFIFRLIERLIATFTTRLMFQTKSDIEEASNYKIGRQEQYTLIGNGITLDAFFNYNRKRAKEIREDLKLKGRKIVGTVGRVSVQKNPKGFIEIARKVLEKRRDTIFIFVGGGELLKEMKRLVNKLNLDEYIIFTGIRDDIPELVTNFDIFILPSLWEGMPRSVIEAMALSKPVVVYDIGGIEELVIEAKNGFVVPFGETDTFADRIRYLLDNQCMSQDLAKSGFVKAKEFDYNLVVERVKKIYVKLYKTNVSSVIKPQ